MEKIISSFNLKTNVKKGKARYKAICPKCEYENEIVSQNKLNRSKIGLYKCANCGYLFEDGDIYNFKDFSLLGNRLDSRFDQEVYIKHDWYQE